LFVSVRFTKGSDLFIVRGKRVATPSLDSGLLRGRSEAGVPADGGAPRLALSGQAAERARARGVKQLHVTLTHSAGVAAAAVILEG